MYQVAQVCTSTIENNQLNHLCLLCLALSVHGVITLVLWWLHCNFDGAFIKWNQISDPPTLCQMGISVDCHAKNQCRDDPSVNATPRLIKFRVI